jgi:hypothetical protein
MLYDEGYRKDVIEKLGHVRAKLSDKYSAEEAANCIISALN